MTSDKATTRRRYSSNFKAQVVAECDAPGASVAKVAISHGINTNIVHGWRRVARESGAIALLRQHEFVPIRLAPPAKQPEAERGLEVKLRRGTLTMKVTSPSSATAGFAAWTRELLRQSASIPRGYASTHWTCAPAPSPLWRRWSASSVPPDRIMPMVQ